MEQAHCCWQISSGCRLSWIAWDDEFVFFNAQSGDTHLLDVVSGEALKNLAAAPASIEDLGRIVHLRLGLPGEVSLLTHLTTLLPKLQELGLIEPAYL